MTKLGKPFELVVADIAREMDPAADVTTGEWVTGPDGRRDVDVRIEGLVDGVQRRILIECKDYDPSKRPVGIGVVDGLDSKRRDLKADVALICSNAGFSADAMRKARRLAIGLLGVLKEDDPRVRYRVVDEVYFRRLDFRPVADCVHIDWMGYAPPQGAMQLGDITYNGLPVEGWLTHQAVVAVSRHPVVEGSYDLAFRCKRPVPFTTPKGIFLAKRLRLRILIAGGWFSQQIEIDATSGLYDWIRQTIRRGPAAGRLVYRNFQIGVGGAPISALPEGFAQRGDVTLGEIDIRIVDLGGVAMPAVWPQLDPFIEDEDLAASPRPLAGGS